MKKYSGGLGAPNMHPQDNTFEYIGKRRLLRYTDLFVNENMPFQSYRQMTSSNTW